MAYWLIKSEPEAYSIDDLKAAKTTIWDGVRNYQARNYLISAKVGDFAFFYHSNAKPPGIVGLATVSAVDVTDPTQFDPGSHYYDATSPRAAPRWKTVRVKYREKFPNFLSLDDLREQFTADDLIILRKGTRLSVTPVDEVIAERLLVLARAKH